jgi:hypothetical protein
MSLRSHHFALPSLFSLSLAFAGAVGCSAGTDGADADGDGTGGGDSGGDGDGTGGGASSGSGAGPGLDVDGDDPPPTGNEETCVELPDGTEECYCLRVAVIGTADSAASDTNATAFRDWLNTKSNALVTVLDPKDPTSPQSKPTLDEAFLANYDVIILQLQGDSKDGPFWTYTQGEIDAVKAWVEAGGGLISLTGYNGMRAAEETAASNALIQPVSGMSYGATDIAGSSGENTYCWGGSVRITDWLDDSIGFEVDAVGAFHGYPVTGGTPVAQDGAGNVIGAVAQVGDGFTLVWGDEWVIFTNQWYAEDPDAQQYTDPYNPCYDKRPEQVFQLPQFWYNALSYAGGARVCLEIDEPTIVVR